MVGELIKLPSRESMRTLVLLESKSHEDHMFSKINEATHKAIYLSWKKIRASLDNEIALQDEDPIECGNGELIHVYDPELYNDRD